MCAMTHSYVRHESFSNTEITSFFCVCVCVCVCLSPYRVVQNGNSACCLARALSVFLSLSRSLSLSLFLSLYLPGRAEQQHKQSATPTSVSLSNSPYPHIPLNERWGAGVETQKNVREEIGVWGRVPFNEPYAPLLSTIYDGA